MAETRVIGVDLGGTKILAGVINERLRVERSEYHPVRHDDQQALLNDIADRTRALIEHAPDARAVGFGIPCTIDRRTGKAVQAVNLPIADVPFAEHMRERLGLPTYIDNDANVAALAEQRAGAARGAEVALMLTIGTGIGGGIVIGGKPFRGSIGAGAELGHIVVDLDGPRCQGACPGRGCLEAIASGTALAREGMAAAARAPGSALGKALANGREITGKQVTAAARAGDATAIEVVREIGRRLGAGITGLVNAFNPEFVVIGGGVGAAGSLLLDPARAEVKARALPPGRDLVQIVPAAFGQNSGMIGAAIMALEESGE